MKKFSKSFYIYFGVASLLLLAVANSFIWAKTASSDAIAIRIMPNPEHYSALRWYQEKSFKGSPQSLTIDGYGAVRDGRTAYVNVGNITEDNKVFTNIYLISYNQDADGSTVDIFGQILSHWKFNVNIKSSDFCHQETNTACAADSDCPIGDYCHGSKPKIIRDVARLADLSDIEKALENYKNKNGYYPKIESGSYLPYRTISAWPSWQDTLGKQLSIGALPADPINKLGDCHGYDRATCWNEQTKKFADPTPDNGQFNLPAGSNVYIYISARDGSSYSLTSGLESGYIDTSGSFHYQGESAGNNQNQETPTVSINNNSATACALKDDGSVTFNCLMVN